VGINLILLVYDPSGEGFLFDILQNRVPKIQEKMQEDAKNNSFHPTE
jgi:hypothetical protein